MHHPLSLTCRPTLSASLSVAQSVANRLSFLHYLNQIWSMEYDKTDFERLQMLPCVCLLWRVENFPDFEAVDNKFSK